MTEQDGDAPDRPGLRGYLRALRRRWRIVLVVCVATVAVALAYSVSATPLYAASADVLVEPSVADVQAGSGTRISSDEVLTQTQVVTSLPVARLVQQRLSLEAIPDLDELVTVQAVGTSRILRITAQDTSAERAAETANTVATAYLQFREQDSIDRYESARERLTKEQAEVEGRLAQVDALIAEDPRSIALQAERRNLLTSLAQIGTQIDALSDSLTTAAAGGSLLRPAETPDDPVSPRTILNVVLGALFGLLLGMGGALLRDRFDDAVHDEDAVRQDLDSVVLGRISQWSDRIYRDRLVTLIDPHAPASEEYQRLGVNVRFMLATAERASGSIVLVTSGREEEGKTVTSCNLAVAAARLGLSVVLVDADLRRSSVAPRFGLGEPAGLSDLLVSEDSLDSYAIDVGVDNLSVLAAGTHPPNPAALLSSARMRLMLSQMASEVDLVIIDSPPLLTGADTLELANAADLVVVVTRERVSRRRDLVGVKETLRHVAAGAVGVVVNGLGDNGRTAYAYTPRDRETAPVRAVESSTSTVRDDAPEAAR